MIREMHNLGIGDAETLAEWFLHHLGPDQRGQLMADLPTVYARVFPGVDPDAIINHVRASLAAIRTEQAGDFAAMADKHIERAGLKPGYGEGGQASLRRALEAARELTEPGEPNTEYIRGQVNLLTDTFALASGNNERTDEEAYAIVTSVITHKITVDAGLSELAALTGAEV